MADNVSIKDASGTTVPIRTDDVGSGVEAQMVKIDVGGDGASQMMDATHPVQVAGTVEAVQGVGKSSSASITRTALSTTSAQILAANAGRRAVIIVNDSTQSCYIKFGTTASATSYTVILGPGQTFVGTLGYTGRIDAALSGGTGNAQVTELT